MAKINMSPEYLPKQEEHNFVVGNIIVCPSDVSGIKWKVTELKKDGTLIIVPAENQKFPSTYYPRGPLAVMQEAKKDWKLIQ
jgi:hypothetical protein